MNIITIDPSINSTAVVINGKPHAFVSSHISWNKSQTKLTKWFNVCEPEVVLHHTDYDFPKDYSDKEVYMQNKFLEISNNILELIHREINILEPIVVAIEGYSYSSNAGPLIDLVTFSTILRQQMNTLVKYLHLKEFTLLVIPPTSLKLESAKLVYKPTNIGKRVEKLVWKSHDGVMGGSFKKQDMCKALIDSEDKSDWVEFLRANRDDILKPKHIPKPIEDINDAMLLYLILRNKEKNQLSLDFKK